MPGESATIESVMPVSTAMNGGIATCGLTSVWNSPEHLPAAHLDRADLGDHGAAGRGAAGGLEVDDAERDLAQGPAQLVERRLHGHRLSHRRSAEAAAVVLMCGNVRATTDETVLARLPSTMSGESAVRDPDQGARPCPTPPATPAATSASGRGASGGRAGAHAARAGPAARGGDHRGRARPARVGGRSGEPAPGHGLRPPARARLAASPISAALLDDVFRERVAAVVRPGTPTCSPPSSAASRSRSTRSRWPR
jgi:hypothetical protein